MLAVVLVDVGCKETRGRVAVKKAFPYIPQLFIAMHLYEVIWYPFNFPKGLCYFNLNHRE